MLTNFGKKITSTLLGLLVRAALNVPRNVYRGMVMAIFYYMTKVFF